ARAGLLQGRRYSAAHLAVPSVVAADGEDDMFSSRKGATQPNRMRRRLAPCVRYLHQLQGRHSLAEPLRQLCLKRRGTAAEKGTVGLDCLDYGVADPRVVVPQQVRRKCGVIVYVFLPFDIIDFAPFSACEDNTRIHLPVE